MVFTLLFENVISLSSYPDKPERIATKAPRHKEELFIIF
jgi:hypothetical protein